MRRSFREPAGGPLSLFAFQDIIFSVTAVLLFATIWFALSTRVQRFSRSQDASAAQPQLAAAIAALAEGEAAQRLAGAGDGEAGEATAGQALERWAHLQLATEQPERVAAELRERVRAQEQQAARSVTAMQSEEAAWAELERRLPLAEQRARDALLRVDAASASRGTIVLVIGARSMDVLTASGGSQTRPLSAATLGAEFRELVGASDSSDAGLWIGVRPSAAPLFDALVTTVEALGCAFHLEPIAEDQSIAFHTPERARALLE